MNRTLLHVVGALLLSSCVLASDMFPYADLSMDHPGSESEVEPRFLFVFNNATTGAFVTFNTTLLLFSAGILLWGIAGAVALYLLLTAPADTRSYDYSGYGSDSGYSSGYSSRANRGCVPITSQPFVLPPPCTLLAAPLHHRPHANPQHITLQVIITPQQGAVKAMNSQSQVDFVVAY